MKKNSSFNSLINNKGFLRYFKNTAWVLFEKVLRIIVGLFIGAWVVRYLGPEDFGLFSFVNSLIYFLIVISSLGLDGVLVRELVKTPKDHAKLMGTSFRLKLISGTTLFLLLLLNCLLFKINSKMSNLIIVISFSMIIQSINVVDFYFQSEVKSRYVVYANIFSLSISSILKVIFIINNFSLFYFGLIVSIDVLALIIGYLYFYMKDNNIKDWIFDIETAKRLLKYGWPFILSGVMIAIYMKVDQIMLKFLIDEKAVGLYAAGVRLSELWYFIPVATASSLFPAIVNAKFISKKLYNDRLQNLYNLMFTMAIIISILVTFFAKWIVITLYGDSFSEASTILIIHIWSGIFVFLGVASEKWMLNENLQRIYAINTLLGSISNVSFNLVLIPRYGPIGAAYATLVSQFLASYLCLLFFKKTRINFYRLTKALFFVNYIKYTKK